MGFRIRHPRYLPPTGRELSITYIIVSWSAIVRSLACTLVCGYGIKEQHIREGSCPGDLNATTSLKCQYTTLGGKARGVWSEGTRQIVRVWLMHRRRVW